MLRRNNDRIISNAARWVIHRPYKQNDCVKLLKKQHSKEEPVLADVEQKPETETQPTTKIKTQKTSGKTICDTNATVDAKDQQNRASFAAKNKPSCSEGWDCKATFTWRSNTFHLDIWNILGK